MVVTNQSKQNAKKWKETNRKKVREKMNGKKENRTDLLKAKNYTFIPRWQKDGRKGIAKTAADRLAIN